MALVETLGRDDVKTEGAQDLEVRLDGTGAQVAAAGVGELEGVIEAHQWAEEHDDASGATGGLDVHVVKVELSRTNEGEVALVLGPLVGDADGRQHLKDAIDLLDVSDSAQHSAATVDETATQQGNGSVLGGTHLDGALELAAAFDAVVHRAATRLGDDGGLKGLGDAVDVLQREVLCA